MLLVAGVEQTSHLKDPFVGFSSHVPLFVEKNDADGNAMMMTAHHKLDYFNSQSFTRNKPKATYRIFCVGGSTTYGRPYDDRTSFAGWMRVLLPLADGARRWEVINAGGVSYASYRVTVVMEELSKYQPDLFVIYSGHNEFLERRTYGDMPDRSNSSVAGLRRRLGWSRIVTMLESLLEEKIAPKAGTSDRYILPEEAVPLLDNVVGPSDFRRDDHQKEMTVRHYRFNMERAVDMAREAGAKVMIVTPASNLKDISPFKSEHENDMTEEQVQRWQRLYHQATQDQSENSLRTIDTLEQQSPRHAGIHHLKGWRLYEKGRYAEAKAAFVRARDEDVCALRALSSIVQVSRDVATEKEVPLVDFEQLMTGLSPHGIPDRMYFMDHVHPNIEGNFLLAKAIVEKMDAVKMVDIGDKWKDDNFRKVGAEVMQKIDKKQHAWALKNLSKVLGWAGKWSEAHRLSIESVKLNDGDAEAHYLVGKGYQLRSKYEEATACYEKALSLDPQLLEAKGSLGVMLTDMKCYDEAIACLMDVLKLQPDDWRAYQTLGFACLESGRLDMAEENLLMALRFNKNSGHAHFYLGQLQEKMGKKQEALQFYRSALALKPGWDLPVKKIQALEP
ncbi:MAG: tetratricopeptide repeat protein [Thermoanaerobaculales bacterium]|nr:tetratricopeptide repeat protein [Thermoanaerobaculales bacterium]